MQLYRWRLDTMHWIQSHYCVRTGGQDRESWTQRHCDVFVHARDEDTGRGDQGRG